MAPGDDGLEQDGGVGDGDKGDGVLNFGDGCVDRRFHHLQDFDLHEATFTCSQSRFSFDASRRQPVPPRSVLQFLNTGFSFGRSTAPAVSTEEVLIRDRDTLRDSLRNATRRSADSTPATGTADIT